MSIGHLTVLTSVLTGVLALAQPARADAVEALRLRSFVVAAHARCALFAPDLAAALDAGRLQARGALLRADVAPATVSTIARRAEARAGTLSCGDPALATVRRQVLDAYGGWSALSRMTFEAGREPWRADRRGAPWRLKQIGRTGASPVTVGQIVDAEGRRQAAIVVSFQGHPRPVAARLVFRDAARAARPILNAAAMASTRKASWASRRAVASRALLEPGQRQGEVWTLDGPALEAIAGLDPREGFEVEFVFRDDSVARAAFKTGDLAAAQAFLAVDR